MQTESTGAYDRLVHVRNGRLVDPPPSHFVGRRPDLSGHYDTRTAGGACGKNRVERPLPLVAARQAGERLGAVAAVTCAFAILAAASPPAVTFTKDVAPVLERNCQACHRPGEAAPFSLLTYEQARPWAKAMKEAVRMK